MKITALVLTATMVFSAIIPSVVQAASDSAAEAAIQRLHAKAVTVMPGTELDLNKLAPGLYAYVVFNLNEAESAAMGRILSCDPDRVVIAAGNGKGWEIARQDIVVVAVADNPGGIELWRMARREMLQVQATSMTVLSGENLDFEELRVGWHAHVDYRSTGIDRSATGVIVRNGANHIAIKPDRRSGVRWTIRSDEIERLIVTRRRDDMNRWRTARESMRELQGPRVRLKAPSISPEWMIGRFAGSVQDTLEILSERGTERVPRALVKDLEVSMGRHRNTIKGMAIGAIAGLGAAFLIYPHDESGDDRRGEVGVKEDADRFFYAVLVVPLTTVSGTLVGARTINEKWVEVSPSRINLSIAPTRQKGLRAALSFKF